MSKSEFAVSPNIKLQLVMFLGLVFAVMICVEALHAHDREIFRPYLGNFAAPVAVLVISMLGVWPIIILLSKGWFILRVERQINGILRAMGAGIAFALIIIMVDLRVVFPQDMNVASPQSLLFYPSIGFVVEIVFHLLPLTALLVVTRPFTKFVDLQPIIWLCILLVALIEAVFQSLGLPEDYSAGTVVYVGLHVFLFGVVQLWLFKRFDFVSMFGMRLTYYLLWHILWGHIRLQVLF